MKKKSAYVFIKLPKMLDPSDRESNFAETIDRSLADAKAGRVAGGGTDFLLRQSLIDAQVKDIEKSLPVVREALTSVGAPNRTQIQYRKGRSNFVDEIENGSWTVGMMQA